MTALAEIAPPVPTGPAALVFAALWALDDVQPAPPTVRQLAEVSGCAVGTAQKAIERLEADGYVHRAGEGRARTLRPLRRLDGTKVPTMHPVREVVLEDGGAAPGSLPLPAGFVGDGPAISVRVDAVEPGVAGVLAGDVVVLALACRTSGPHVILRDGRTLVGEPGGLQLGDDVLGAVLTVLRSLSR